ncbi:MAG: tetratricopeptide repeat protein, partial [Anaerolineae bacterium]
MAERRTPPEAPGAGPRPRPRQDPGREPRGGTWRWAILALGLVFCSLSMVLGAAALGAYHGARDRLVAMQAAAQEHYQRGLEHRQAGEWELARVEFEEALRLNPGMEEARQQLSEVLGALAAQPTATSEARTQAVVALLEEAQALYRAGQWEEAARRLETVRSLDPDFQPDLLAELLYNAYLGAAQEMEKAGRDEEALAYYGKALALR